MKITNANDYFDPILFGANGISLLRHISIWQTLTNFNFGVKHIWIDQDQENL